MLRRGGTQKSCAIGVDTNVEDCLEQLPRVHVTWMLWLCKLLLSHCHIGNAELYEQLGICSSNSERPGGRDVVWVP